MKMNEADAKLTMAIIICRIRIREAITQVNKLISLIIRVFDVIIYLEYLQNSSIESVEVNDGLHA
jgi:hypothetical protein